MKITEYKKKNGAIVYRASVYLGVDKLTGKKARTTVTANTKKGIRIKAREAVNAFANNGYSVKEKPTITTYRELVSLWWESYKNTIKPNSQQAIYGGDCETSYFARIRRLQARQAYHSYHSATGQ